MDINEIGIKNYFEEDRGFKNGAGEVYYYNFVDPVQAVASAAQLGLQASDDKQRREFDRAVGRLSVADQKKLAQQLQKAQSRDAKLALITSEINKFQIEQSKKQTTNIALIIGGSLVFLIAIVYLAKD
jgi:hypothetical protein